jgi:Zn-finger nucleic acid-binding protein
MRAAIERTPAGAVELDYCPSCRGIWFDRGELEAILLQVQSDIQPIGLPAPSDDPATRRCPHHQVLMVERTLSTARLRSSLYGAGSDLPAGVQDRSVSGVLGHLARWRRAGADHPGDAGPESASAAQAVD